MSPRFLSGCCTCVLGELDGEGEGECGDVVGQFD